jgi:hypothetical protein
MTAERRLPHDDEARSLQMLDDPLGGDPRVRPRMPEDRAAAIPNLEAV